MTAHYLFKTEPDEYSLDDLARDGTIRWDCIRNYGARNRLRECRPADLVLFYHSGRSPAVVGLARVASEPYPDPTQFDAEHEYADPKAKPEAPRWWSVDIEFVEAFAKPVSLAEMKAAAELADLEVLARQRLSVSLVSPDEFAWIVGRASG